jgi:hypothetical protein
MSFPSAAASDSYRKQAVIRMTGEGCDDRIVAQKGRLVGKIKKRADPMDRP